MHCVILQLTSLIIIDYTIIMYFLALIKTSYLCDKRGWVHCNIDTKNNDHFEQKDAKYILIGSIPRRIEGQI